MNPLYFIICVFALAFGSSFGVNADETLPVNSSMVDDAETANSITWPLLPDESVNDVARLFYPKNSAMQQQFVAKTLRLNSEKQLKASSRFNEPTLLLIPTLKSLSKNVANTNKKSKPKSLKMSYGLKQLVEKVPQNLLLEYDELVNKNAFLKAQLVKLNEKIGFLEIKLGELKLIFDKTLTLSKTDLSVAPAPSLAPAPAPAPATAIAQVEVPVLVPVIAPAVTFPAEPVLKQTDVNQTDVNQISTSQPQTKKVFKNLNNLPATPEAALEAPPETSFFNNLNMDLLKAALACTALLVLGAFALKKYRERMLASLSFASTKMQNTVTDFSGYFEKTKLAVVPAPGPETVQQQQAAKEVETRLSATLEEAKLLMSVNRGTDAIAHLKMTIESQPKASINHWLYLLEVFRKLNLKDEFENYANRMHETFNVMTPVWYEIEVAVNTVMIVPQSLEEFPHIIEQLQGIWPGELAGVYLRSLITDNRGGERLGFGKAVVNEILFLIEVLDTFKDIPNS